MPVYIHILPLIIKYISVNHEEIIMNFITKSDQGSTKFGQINISEMTFEINIIDKIYLLKVSS